MVLLHLGYKLSVPKLWSCHLEWSVTHSLTIPHSSLWAVFDLRPGWLIWFYFCFRYLLLHDHLINTCTRLHGIKLSWYHVALNLAQSHSSHELPHVSFCHSIYIWSMLLVQSSPHQCNLWLWSFIAAIKPGWCWFCPNLTLYNSVTWRTLWANIMVCVSCLCYTIAL